MEVAITTTYGTTSGGKVDIMITLALNHLMVRGQISYGLNNILVTEENIASVKGY